MNRTEIINSFKRKSDENFELYKFLSKENRFIEWQAVSIFYSALCYVKSYLYSKSNMPEDGINSHLGIKFWLTSEKDTKNLMIYEKYYAFLYNYSRDARYKCNTITPSVIVKMLDKYNKIKELI